MLTMAGGALAQQEQAAPLGRFYGPLVTGDGASKLFQGNPTPGVLPLKLVLPQPVNAAPRPTVSRCAVPLAEMKAPMAVDPAIQFVPRMDALAPMPQAKLPPPAKHHRPAKAGAR